MRTRPTKPGKPAAKQGDRIVGIDTHVLMVPSPGGPVPTRAASISATRLCRQMTQSLVVSDPAATAQEKALLSMPFGIALGDVVKAMPACVAPPTASRRCPARGPLWAWRPAWLYL